jgi:hypothetical protein
MPIELQCACGAKYRVPDNTRGRKVRCKHCQALIPVPEEQPAAVEAVEVVEEVAERAEARADELEPAPAEREKRRKKDKKKKKKRDKEWAGTLEERMARREEGSWRKNEVRRGWKFMITGFSLIGIGIMLSISLYAVKTGDPAGATTDYGIASLALRTIGVWGPTIGLSIASLVPIAFGVMNFMGFGLVVEERDD